jgi:hypothetical protein
MSDKLETPVRIAITKDEWRQLRILALGHGTNATELLAVLVRRYLADEAAK